MARYRAQLPQLSDKLFMTDGGMETTLIFHDGIDLPCFAAFDLLRNRQGEQKVLDYYRRYASMARQHNVGFVLESPTWRASADWGDRLGYSRNALEKINLQSIEILEQVRDEYEDEGSPMVISGCLGPRDDGYNPQHFMTVDQARHYHLAQITTFSNSQADLVSAFTITYSLEATGIVRAAQQVGMPVVISFTVEVNGLLPSGETLKQAIQTVDETTDHGPAYYMINCAHPSHFENILVGDDGWLERIKGIRANASCKSHAELDEATELDDGDPEELGKQYRVLKQKLKDINIVGGCCGTDHRHVEQICKAALAA